MRLRQSVDVFALVHTIELKVARVRLELSDNMGPFVRQTEHAVEARSKSAFLVLGVLDAILLVATLPVGGVSVADLHMGRGELRSRTLLSELIDLKNVDILGHLVGVSWQRVRVESFELAHPVSSQLREVTVFIQIHL
jgi:hypothetical protein